MLRSLQIKDYALIDQVNIDFEKGLNIITGETGAGKSILIDAMSLLLGERASTEVVRKGASKSFVEGIFNVEGNEKAKKIIDENELDDEPELIIRREISLKGSNRCFVNDSPVPLSVVKELGDLLVDLHGQHEHQSLLKTETHINFIDEFAGNEKLINSYQSQFNKLKEKIIELGKLRKQESSLKEKREIYEFQIKEIDAVNPEPGEDEKLNNELNILENSEKLLELTNEIYDQLYDNENSVNDQIGDVSKKISQLGEIDKSFSEIENDIDSALSIIQEISGAVRSYHSKIDIDPDEVEEKRERLGALNLLKKKYGSSLEKVIEHRNKIGNEFNLVENFADEIKKIESDIVSSRKSTGEAAEKLSQSRKKITNSVEKQVQEMLSRVGIPDAKFEVRIKQTESKDEDHLLVKNKRFGYSENGIDDIEFFITTNPGEDLKPLAKVASGGEISRIMLSLKSILAKSDKLPLLIFDEIDTGVSGRIAQKVGTALKELASFHQVIAITHLPQIAGLADQHYVVQKLNKDGRVVSGIRKLDDEEKIEEIAKLMSGEKVTEASLKSARELVGK